MKLLKLIFFNAVMWGAFHLVISATIFKLNIHKHSNFRWIFKSYEFEKNGETWNRLFKIKKIKPKLPESTMIMPSSFDLSHMENTESSTLKTYISETNRAELTHWLSILPAPLFFLWNPRKFWLIHILYAVLSNIPFILAQRYNRPRLQKLHKIKSRRKLEGA